MAISMSSGGAGCFLIRLFIPLSNVLAVISDAVCGSLVLVPAVPLLAIVVVRQRLPAGPPRGTERAVEVSVRREQRFLGATATCGGQQQLRQMCWFSTNHV
eukprot:3487032-Pleurochrysis_carterae.AAC.2